MLFWVKICQYQIGVSQFSIQSRLAISRDPMVLQIWFWYICGHNNLSYHLIPIWSRLVMFCFQVLEWQEHVITDYMWFAREMWMKSQEISSELILSSIYTFINTWSCLNRIILWMFATLIMVKLKQMWYWRRSVAVPVVKMQPPLRVSLVLLPLPAQDLFCT
jgi:hypothetical protein